MNLPTYNVYVSETATAAKAAPFAAGTIGLGSYATQCDYRNVTITTADGKTQTVDLSQLNQLRGTWKAEGGVMSQTSNEQLTMALLNGFSSNDYTLSLQARKTGGLEGFFIYYGMDAQGRNGYAANLAGWNNQTSAIQPIRGGRTNDVLGRQVRHTVENNKWYDVKIVVKPEQVTVSVDGKDVLSVRPQGSTRQFCQTGYDTKSGELIVKVVNGTDQPYTRTFNIAGAGTVTPQGKVITLSGDANAENSFEQPKLIAPVESTYAKFGKQFTYEFKPMSYTILRIKTK